jgi:hypothetical protein
LQLSGWIPRKHIIRIDVQRPEAELKFVMQGKLGHPFPRAIDEQELLYRDKAVCDNSPGTTRSKMFGDRA